MSQERNVQPELKSLLQSEGGFDIGYLVKFERAYPINKLYSKYPTDATRYSYITDASYDVTFDDGSTDLAGNANGPQVYIANKIKNIGSITQQIEANAGSTSLVLDGVAIGALLPTSSVVVTQITSVLWDIAWPSTLNIIDAGFSVGDKVLVNGSSYLLRGFISGNKTRLEKIDADLSITSTASMSLASDEILSLLVDKSISSTNGGYINREVFIYRVYSVNGVFVGTPILLFKGLINSVNFEDALDSITVTWNLTNHWGQFNNVAGRITSDESHRALNENNIPQPNSAKKAIYAYDKGFVHADTSINLLASYSVQYQDVQVKKKKGFLGIFPATYKTTVSTKTRLENTNINLQLQAKALPVVYGVRNLDGIPIFADTLKDNSSVVYVAYALAEGEIGGLYDILVDGNSLICADKADAEARDKSLLSSTSDNVSVYCIGRADRGDVLGGTNTANTGALTEYYNSDLEALEGGRNFVSSWYYNGYVAPTTPSASSNIGVASGETVTLTSNQNITIDFFSGASGQKAANSIIKEAIVNNFKIQDSYWTGADTDEYWGPNHRLLDTAYVVVRFQLNEGETTIPSLSFSIKGKFIQSYNYDGSYTKDPTRVSSDFSAFNYLDTVTVKTQANIILVNNATIIDKWTFVNPDGSIEERIRLDKEIPLGFDADGVPSITSFKLEKGDGGIWNVITWNNVIYYGVVPNAIKATYTGATSNAGDLVLNYSASTGVQNNYSGITSFSDFVFTDASLDLGYEFDNSNLLTMSVLQGQTFSTSGNSGSVKLPVANNALIAGAVATIPTSGTLIASVNTIQLPSNTSSSNDYYNGYKITVTRVDVEGLLEQEAIITGYSGSTKIATVDSTWLFVPDTGDKIAITKRYNDLRCSINPVIQTMDYLTSKTYGKGLSAIKDLNLTTCIESAQLVDARSNVFVKSTSNLAATTGIQYRYPASGEVLWAGTLVAKNGFYYEFSKNIGKLTNKWKSWKSYKLNSIVYNSKNQVYVVTSAGIKLTEPIHTSGTVNGMMFVNSLSLTRVGSTGLASIPLITEDNPVQYTKNGLKISGYSLYDSDSIDYWRLIGWDNYEQRQVTQYQSNTIIDTSATLFDNTNSMLSQYNGMLSYDGAKYSITVQKPEDLTPFAEDSVYSITEDNIIGEIQISDEGSKDTFNSLTASFADPANKFEGRNISFFNSEYLAIDKGVTRKGNITVTSVTNYYNTRILADNYLNKSRFSLNISMTIDYAGVLMLAGKVIEITYPRFKWVRKRFLLKTVDNLYEGLTDITATEFDNSFFSISNIDTATGTGLASSLTNIKVPSAPTNIVISTDKYSEIEISWVNPEFLVSTAEVEVWRSADSNIQNAVLLATVPSRDFKYIDSALSGTTGSVVSYYYWLRYKT